MILTIALSLTAALLFAVAAVLQQVGTTTVADNDALSAGMLTTLVHTKVWLVGMAADIVGFGVQAAALATGSLLVVQPILATTLFFALPLGARVDRRRLTVREWSWSGLLVVSLVLFVAFGQPTAGISRPSFRSWIPVFVLSAPVLGWCLVSARSQPHGARRSLRLAIAAGVMLGLAAPLTKSAADTLGTSVLAGIGSWEFWGMALAASLGTFWQQSSYQAGDVQTSLPTVSVFRPAVAMALGLTIYQEHLVGGDAASSLLVVALVLMGLATINLSRLASPAVQRSTGSARTV